MEKFKQTKKYMEVSKSHLTFHFPEGTTCAIWVKIPPTSEQAQPPHTCRLPAYFQAASISAGCFVSVSIVTVRSFPFSEIYTLIFSGFTVFNLKDNVKKPITKLLRIM